MSSENDQPLPGAVSDVQSLVPFSLRRKSAGAVKSLATEIQETERPIALVFGNPLASPGKTNGQLLLVTDRRILIAPLTGAQARSIPYAAIESFSARNADPLSYGLDRVTLGLSQSMGAHFVFRFRDGERLTLANIQPERRAFTVSQRIAWYRRRAALPTEEIDKTVAAAQNALKSAGVAAKVARDRALRAGAPSSKTVLRRLPPDWRDEKKKER